MLNELTLVIRRVAGALLLAGGILATAPASAQQRLSLADLQAQITALQAQVSGCVNGTIFPDRHYSFCCARIAGELYQAGDQNPCFT